MVLPFQAEGAEIGEVLAGLRRRVRAAMAVDEVEQMGAVGLRVAPRAGLPTIAPAVPGIVPGIVPAIVVGGLDG